jgi:hypothetical protein
MSTARFLSAVSASWLLAFAASGAEWHVKTSGSDKGSGSEGSPWDLQTALNHPAAVKPGDTIWVHGGNYTSPKNDFPVNLIGTASAPIKVQAVNGERATLKGHVGMGYNGAKAQYCWLMGVEVQCRPGGGVELASGADVRMGLKVINCIIHDNGYTGVSWWRGAGESEIHGCVIYYNGYDDGGGRGRCHGFYIQNIDKPKTIKNCISFRNFNMGSQIWSSGKAPLNNVTHQSSTFFNNGEISKTKSGTNMWLSADGDCKAIECATYSSGAMAGQTGCRIGGGTTNFICKDNYFQSAAGTALEFNADSGMKMTGNTVVGKVSRPMGGGNENIAGKPSGKKVLVRANEYEKGRAEITVFNWDKAGTVDADVSSVLKAGDAYELRDAQNYFGKPAAAGTYAGGSISIPMTGLSVAAPIDLKGYETPPHTAPEFGAFVLLPKGKAH